MKLLLDYQVCGTAQAANGQFTGAHFMTIKNGFRSLSERLEASLKGVVDIECVSRNTEDFGLLNENLAEPGIAIEVEIETSDPNRDIEVISQTLDKAVQDMVKTLEASLKAEATAELMRCRDLSLDGCAYCGDTAMVKWLIESNQDAAPGDNDRFMIPVLRWFNEQGMNGLATLAKSYT